MLPFIIAGAVVVSGVVTYFVRKDGDKKKASNRTPDCPSLGTLAIWGRPDVGKTTFMNFLLGNDHQCMKKEATTHRREYSNTKVRAAGCEYLIKTITDMPGTMDRMDDWLDQVRQSDHVFYMLDASREDGRYVKQILHDLKETVTVIREVKAGNQKKIHIIVTHIDLSRFKDFDTSTVHNELQQDDFFREIYESGEGVCGYVYVANLTDPSSCERLMTSIVGDCYGA